MRSSGDHVMRATWFIGISPLSLIRLGSVGSFFGAGSPDTIAFSMPVGAIGTSISCTPMSFQFMYWIFPAQPYPSSRAKIEPNSPSEVFEAVTRRTRRIVGTKAQIDCHFSGSGCGDPYQKCGQVLVAVSYM